jgi:hypothetical protein
MVVYKGKIGDFYPPGLLYLLYRVPYYPGGEREGCKKGKIRLMWLVGGGGNLELAD